jgi:hypothetical protein
MNWLVQLVCHSAQFYLSLVTSWNEGIFALQLIFYHSEQFKYAFFVNDLLILLLPGRPQIEVPFLSPFISVLHFPIYQTSLHLLPLTRPRTYAHECLIKYWMLLSSPGDIFVHKSGWTFMFKRRSKMKPVIFWYSSEVGLRFHPPLLLTCSSRNSTLRSKKCARLSNIKAILPYCARVTYFW